MMMRRLVLILSALSLLIAAMLIAACVCGQWRSDQIIWQRADRTTNTWRSVSVQNGTAGIHVFWQRFDFQGTRDTLAYARALSMPPGVSHWTSAPQRFALPGDFSPGFGFGFSPVSYDTALGDPYSETYNRVDLPYWALIPAFLAAGLAPVRPIIARRRRVRRLAAGCCLSCGYDLRAALGRCPECGRATDQPPHHAPVQQTAGAGTGAVE